MKDEVKTQLTTIRYVPGEHYDENTPVDERIEEAIFVIMNAGVANGGFFLERFQSAVVNTVLYKIPALASAIADDDFVALRFSSNINAEIFQSVVETVKKAEPVFLMQSRKNWERRAAWLIEQCESARSNPYVWDRLASWFEQQRRQL